jgi:glutamine synthetase
VLVLCSVYNPDDTPHVTNTRAMLENMLTPAMLAEKPLYGFEQARRPRPLPGPRHPRDV